MATSSSGCTLAWLISTSISASRKTLTGAALACAILVAHIGIVAGGRTWAGRDNVIYAIPARAHLGASLRAGQLPEWWDAIGLGVPFAANPNGGALYPPAWICALAPPAMGSDLLVLAHLVLLALGGAALARRLGADEAGAFVGGAALALSGFVVTTTSNRPRADHARVDAVDPGRRRRAEVPAARRAHRRADRVGRSGRRRDRRRRRRQLGARAGQRPTLGGVALAYAAAALLAAVAILPATALLGESQRAGGLPLAEAARWSLQPSRLLELVWPSAVHVAPSGGPGMECRSRRRSTRAPPCRSSPPSARGAPRAARRSPPRRWASCSSRSAGTRRSSRSSGTCRRSASCATPRSSSPARSSCGRRSLARRSPARAAGRSSSPPPSSARPPRSASGRRA